MTMMQAAARLACLCRRVVRWALYASISRSSDAWNARHVDPLLRLVPRRRGSPLARLLLVIAVAGCSAPVKVERVDLHTAYEDLNRTALSSNQLSETTRTVLRRAALLDAFDAYP